MAGMVKRKYTSETRLYQKGFTRLLKSISEALPTEYDRHILLEMFKELFPLEWDNLKQRYELYESKDQFLISMGKKKRYYHDQPEVFFFNLTKVKHMLSAGQKHKHKTQFDPVKSKIAYDLLFKKCVSKKINHDNKMASINRNLQVVEPLYVDVFINTYHRKGVTITDKIEIFNELKKYNCKKTIEFFQKLNDSERNNQVRRMAFDHLQKAGVHVRLRKSFKGKVKTYNIEKDSFDVSPEDLYRRIESNSVQNKKKFHVFISHSYKDTALVRKLKDCLNSNQITVYCDWTSDSDFLKRNLASNYTEMILKKRIEQSTVIVFLETSNSMGNDGSILSNWVNMEIDYANQLSKPIYYLNFSNNNSPFKLLQHCISDSKLTILPSELAKLRT